MEVVVESFTGMGYSLDKETLYIIAKESINKLSFLKDFRDKTWSLRVYNKKPWCDQTENINPLVDIVTRIFGSIELNAVFIQRELFVKFTKSYPNNPSEEITIRDDSFIKSVKEWVSANDFYVIIDFNENKNGHTSKLIKHGKLTIYIEAMVGNIITSFSDEENIPINEILESLKRK